LGGSGSIEDSAISNNSAIVGGGIASCDRKLSIDLRHLFPEFKQQPPARHRSPQL